MLYNLVSILLNFPRVYVAAVGIGRRGSSPALGSSAERGFGDIALSARRCHADVRDEKLEAAQH